MTALLVPNQTYVRKSGARARHFFYVSSQSHNRWHCMFELWVIMEDLSGKNIPWWRWRLWLPSPTQHQNDREPVSSVSPMYPSDKDCSCRLAYIFYHSIDWISHACTLFLSLTHTHTSASPTRPDAQGWHGQICLLPNIVCSCEKSHCGTKGPEGET